MNHLICGVTQSGKTTLARYMTREFLRRKQRVIVYDPVGSPTLGGDWGESARVFDDPDELMEFLNSDDPEANHAHVFIDEADTLFSVAQKENHWLLRRGSHFGLTIYCITQRPVLVAPSVRSMCARAYCFRLVQSDIKQIAADYGFDDAHRFQLDKGDFICFTAGVGEYKRGNVFAILPKS